MKCCTFYKLFQGQARPSLSRHTLPRKLALIYSSKNEQNLFLWLSFPWRKIPTKCLFTKLSWVLKNASCHFRHSDADWMKINQRIPSQRWYLSIAFAVNGRYNSFIRMRVTQLYHCPFRRWTTAWNRNRERDRNSRFMYSARPFLQNGRHWLTIHRLTSYVSH